MLHSRQGILSYFIVHFILQNHIGQKLLCRELNLVDSCFKNGVGGAFPYGITMDILLMTSDNSQEVLLLFG